MNKERIRDKYWSLNDPRNDIDYVEISANEEELALIIQKHNSLLVTDVQRSRKKKERLIRKIFKAAALILTNRQFQIFVLRTVCALKEKDIAQQLNVNQSYVSNVLRVSNQKIKKVLRLNYKET